MQIIGDQLIEKSTVTDIKPTVYRYLSFWPLIVITTLIFLVLAWAHIRRSVPLYRSTATLIIQENKGMMESSGTKVSMDPFSPPKTIENEIEVLRSRSVMREVVKNLNLYAPVYLQGNVKSVSAYTQSPIQIEVKDPDHIKAQDKTYFRYDSTNRLVIIKNNPYPLNMWINSPWGIIRFVSNRRYKPSGTKPNFFFYIVSLKNTVNGYSSRLALSTANKTATILSISINDENPRRGEDILNELIHVYKQLNIADKNTIATGTLSFLEKRLGFVTQELDSAESVIERYKAGNKIVDIPVQGRMIMGSMENNEQLRTQFTTQLAVLNQVEKYITGKTNPIRQERPGTMVLQVPKQNEISFNKTSNDGRITSIREQLNLIQKQLENLPAVPAVNKYKNMNIISVLSENRELTKKGSPAALAKIEANKLKLAELEKQVTSPENRQHVIGLRKELLQQKVSLEQRLNNLSETINQYEASKEIQSPAVATAFTAPSLSGLNDEVLTLLLQNLYEAENQYEKLKQTTGENNPALVSLRNQIDKIKPDILGNIRSLRSNLQAGLSKFSGTGERFAAGLKAMPAKERELTDISRQQVIKNNLYKFLLQKREETALSLASTVSDSRLVDSAESSAQPVSPNKPFIYAIALTLGLAGSLGYVTLKDVLDKRIHDRQEIEELSAFPIIGEIPYVSSKKPFIISAGERTFAAEQIRQLRTSLSFIGIDTARKKVLITSSVPGEGKSFIASNLAISLAMAEKKVVLLELDLRKPRLAEVFEVNRDTGISDYLAGILPVEDIIRQTQTNENLYLIPAGAIPRNPTELLLNGRLEKLLAYLDEHFESIIIETAPVSAVTDAYIISRLCDATLYVIREGVTSREDVLHLDDNTKIKELKNPAIIYNGIKRAGLSKYGYEYNYSD